MFLLGYIAAPPTITVFSWAGVVSAAIMPSANAVTAAVVSAAFRAKFMKPSRSACRSHERSRNTNTGDRAPGCPGSDHRRVSLPLPMTGPVGSPLGEPPGWTGSACGADHQLADREPGITLM